MTKVWVAGVCVLAAAILLGAPLLTARANDPDRAMPAPVLDMQPGSGLQTAVFAGGCFWGVQGVFEHVAGVTRAVSGYTGGSLANPNYQQVSSGATGHAESVMVTFDPARVSYGKLLQIFFSVALDPTQVNRQGPDWGSQYRSALFVDGAEQERVARAYLAQLTAAHVFSAPIATQIEPVTTFTPAEAYHQDYLELHPNAPYIAINDMPKVHGVQTLFPESWQATPVLTSKAASGT